jgi:hypothetical protein
MKLISFKLCKNKITTFEFRRPISNLNQISSMKIVFQPKVLSFFFFFFLVKNNCIIKHKLNGNKITRIYI